MKHQYFGDLNDYVKYALLRRLASAGLSIGVCWMLTPGDGGSDGGNRGYLGRPDLWRPLDPPLFDFLRRAARRGRRSLARIERSGLLRDCGFFPETLPDDRRGRSRFFAEFGSAARGNDLVFFDPDNGAEVESKPMGWKGSSKHLAWEEVSAFWALRKSVAFYQHFPRVPRASYLAKLRRRFRSAAPAAEIFAVRARHVAFLIAAQSGHAAAVRAAVSGMSATTPPSSPAPSRAR